MKKIDEWWCSLTTEDRERISKKAGGPGVYPFNTSWWMNLEKEKKVWIMTHCEVRHGLITPMWNEGQMYSE